MKMRDKMKILSEYRDNDKTAAVYETNKGTFSVVATGADSTTVQREFGTEFEAECWAEDFVLAVDGEKIILKPARRLL